MLSATCGLEFVLICHLLYIKVNTESHPDARVIVTPSSDTLDLVLTIVLPFILLLVPVHWSWSFP